MMQSDWRRKRKWKCRSLLFIWPEKKLKCKWNKDYEGTSAHLYKHWDNEIKWNAFNAPVGYATVNYMPKIGCFTGMVEIFLFQTRIKKVRFPCWSEIKGPIIKFSLHSKPMSRVRFQSIGKKTTYSWIHNLGHVYNIEFSIFHCFRSKTLKLKLAI